MCFTSACCAVQLSVPELLSLVSSTPHVTNTLQHVVLPVQLSEAEVRGIMLQLLTAVQYLHRNGVWHRDIKSANILMTYTNGVRCAADAGYKNAACMYVAACFCCRHSAGSAATVRYVLSSEAQLV
jgi:serine/threonine protein kinase